jgi:hypothetical protein
MSKEKEFYQSVKDHLLRMAEYLTILEKNGSKNVEEEISFLRDHLNYVDYRCNLYLRIFNTINSLSIKDD